MIFNSSNFVIYLTMVISISINYIFLNYIENLERISCKCSENWKRKYIKFYSTYLIVMQSFIIIVNQDILIKYLKTIIPFYAISQLSGLLYIYSLYSYSSNLNDIECRCSNKWERHLMFYYSSVILITILIIFIMNMIYFSILLYKQSLTL